MLKNLICDAKIFFLLSFLLLFSFSFSQTLTEKEKAYFRAEQEKVNKIFSEENLSEIEKTWVRNFKQYLDPGTTDPKEIEYMKAVYSFRDNYYYSTPLDTTRASIRSLKKKREQCLKKTFGLIEDCDFALQILIIVILGGLVIGTAFALALKFKLFRKIRFYFKKKHGTHSLDDIFEKERTNK